MISSDITLIKNYIVFDIKNETNIKNYKKINKLIKKMEKSNVLLSKNLINGLMSLKQKDYQDIHDSLIRKFKPLKGDTFRSVFASSNQIEDEFFSFDDFVKQLNHYFVSYGLGIYDQSITDKDSERKVNKKDVSTKKEKQELNKNFKIINLKSVLEFKEDIKTMIYSPVVFGETERIFIKEYGKHYDISELIEDNIKVKENLFSIIEMFPNIEIDKMFQTVTDVLRFIYLINDYDYRNLPLTVFYSDKTLKFKLKTSEKRKIMKTLNRLASKNLVNVYGEMYPRKSHWIAISKTLYPGSKKFNKYNNAQTLFDMLRNKDKHVQTFNGKVAQFINENKYIELAELLATNNPGLLMRSLDMIIRNLKKGETKKLISILEKVELNPKLILQINSWLSFRQENDLIDRTFNVKGKIHQSDKSLKKLKNKRTTKVIDTLTNKIKKDLKGKTLW